jgi:hypothetical protein
MAICCEIFFAVLLPSALHQSTVCELLGSRINKKIRALCHSPISAHQLHYVKPLTLIMNRLERVRFAFKWPKKQDFRRYNPIFLQPFAFLRLSLIFAVHF